MQQDSRGDTADGPRRSTRRALLRASGVAAVAGVAGCLGSVGLGGTDSGGSGSLDDHPATSGLASQPSLGPAPGEATATIVAFEDPSCTRCRTFERETVPKIRSKLTDPGKATFVFRGYPIVYEWGKPATRALEATLVRDEAAHWSLVDHYFETQDAFSPDNVLDRTAAFLDGETSVDGKAVVDAVESGDADDAVGTDLDAGEAGDASVTPAVYMFRDGEFRTKSSGSVSYETIASVLGF